MHFHVHIFPRCVITHLIVANFSDSKVFRVRMRKIETTHARSRMHRKRFGQDYSRRFSRRPARSKSVLFSV